LLVAAEREDDVLALVADVERARVEEQDNAVHLEDGRLQSTSALPYLGGEEAYHLGEVVMARAALLAAREYACSRRQSINQSINSPGVSTMLMCLRTSLGSFAHESLERKCPPNDASDWKGNVAS